MNKNNIKGFQKNIWIFWSQGWSFAPTLIKDCKDSWVINNPEWDVKTLDSNSFKEYSDLSFDSNKLKNLSIAHKSDLIRLELLDKYGGVWVDASLFCLIPLDNWIFNNLNSGLFFFECGSKCALITNWFIASKPNHKTIKLIKKELLLFWLNNNFGRITAGKKFFQKVLTSILNSNKFTTRFWFNPVVTKILRIYPYQIFFFIFDRIIRRKKIHSKVWADTPKISKYICWPFQNSHEPPSNNLKYRVKKTFVPIIKLNWRDYDIKKNNQNSLINYLNNLIKN